MSAGRTHQNWTYRLLFTRVHPRSLPASPTRRCFKVRLEELGNQEHYEVGVAKDHAARIWDFVSDAGSVSASLAPSQFLLILPIPAQPVMWPSMSASKTGEHNEEPAPSLASPPIEYSNWLRSKLVLLVDAFSHL